jgi:hypothetical protein
MPPMLTQSGFELAALNPGCDAWIAGQEDTLLANTDSAPKQESPTGKTLWDFEFQFVQDGLELGLHLFGSLFLFLILQPAQIDRTLGLV